MGAFEIQGEHVALPVEIRESAAWSAMFTVPSAAAGAIIDYSGLEVFQPLPGKAVCSLAFVCYLDGDIGPYHEFAVAFLVRTPHRRNGKPGAFIHRLPVNQSFTLDAGRTIWGFPKELMDIRIRASGGRTRCTVRDNGTHVLTMHTAPGLPVPPGRSGTAIDAYSHLDGTTRRTTWRMRPGGMRARPAGMTVQLGRHPLAEELRSLGLPKTPLLTSGITGLAMTFDGATEIT